MCKGNGLLSTARLVLSAHNRVVEREKPVGDSMAEATVGMKV